MGINLENMSTANNIEAAQNMYFVAKARMILQAALEEAKIENLFKTLKDIKADTEIVINRLVIGIETLLDIMIIIL